MIFIDNHKNCYTIAFRPTQSKYICPACHQERKKKNEKSLYINRNTLVGKCYNCERVFFEHKEVDNIVKEYRQPKELQTNISQSVIDYFKDRSISASSLNHLKVTNGLCFMPQVAKEVNTINFNYYKSGKLINIKHRDNLKNFMFEKDCEVTFYNFDVIYKHDKIVICEGEIDTLSFVEAGIHNVVSLPNGCNNTSFLNQYIFDVERVKEWVLCLDKDNGGMHARGDLIGKLGIEKCSVINTKDCKDANSFLIKYGCRELENAYKSAEKIIINENDYDIDFILKESVIDKNIKTDPYKIILGQKTTDHDGNERVIEIFTSGNISMINGKSKSRKTFSIMQILSMIIKPDKDFVSSYENGIVLFDTEQFKHHSLRFYKRLSEIVSVKKFWMHNLRAYNKDVRLKFIKQYIETVKPSLAIIDNIRDVIRNFNDIDQSDDVMTLLSNLSETTGTHICCTLHVNKTDENARGHIGSEITQKAETVLMVRTFEESGITEISPEYTRNEKFKYIQFEIIGGKPQRLDVQKEVKQIYNQVPF